MADATASSDSRGGAGRVIGEWRKQRFDLRKERPAGLSIRAKCGRHAKKWQGSPNDSQPQTTFSASPTHGGRQALSTLPVLWITVHVYEQGAQVASCFFFASIPANRRDVCVDTACAPSKKLSSGAERGWDVVARPVKAERERRSEQASRRRQEKGRGDDDVRRSKKAGSSGELGCIACACPFPTLSLPLAPSVPVPSHKAWDEPALAIAHPALILPSTSRTGISACRQITVPQRKKKPGA